MSYYLDMVSNTLLLLVIILYLPGVRSLRQLLKYIICLLVILISSCIALYMGNNLLWIMRGSLSNLSITTTILLFVLLLNNLYGTKFRVINQPFAIIVVLFCTILYLSVFGILSFDLYDLGFTPNIYLLSIFFIVLIFLWCLLQLNAWVLLVGFICYYCKLHNSINLWDYLVDPVLWLFSVIFLYYSIFKKVKLN